MAGEHNLSIVDFPIGNPFSLRNAESLGLVSRIFEVMARLPFVYVPRIARGLPGNSKQVICSDPSLGRVA